MPDIRKQKVATAVAMVYFDFYKKYSSWRKLIYVISYFFHFINYSRAKFTNWEIQIGCLTNKEKTYAIHFWCKTVQASQFQN